MDLMTGAVLVGLGSLALSMFFYARERRLERQRMMRYQQELARRAR